MRDAKNQPNESESARRAGSLAEPHRGTVNDVSHDDIARTRHDEEAARRQELDLDNPQPLDASRNLAERVRATFRTTAEAEAAEAEAAEAERMRRKRMRRRRRRKPVMDVPPSATGRS